MQFKHDASRFFVTTAVDTTILRFSVSPILCYNSDVRMVVDMTDNVAIGDLVEVCLAIPWHCKRFANGSCTCHDFCTCNKIRYVTELLSLNARLPWVC